MKVPSRKGNRCIYSTSNLLLAGRGPCPARSPRSFSNQRNMLFTYDGTEYGPLLKTPRAFVVYARGGTYAEDSPTPASRFDHQKGYIDFWLKFIGVKEVHTLVVEGTTWRGKEKGDESIARGQVE